MGLHVIEAFCFEVWQLDFRAEFLEGVNACLGFEFAFDGFVNPLSLRTN